jgi:hypothetical protein
MNYNREAESSWAGLKRWVSQAPLMALGAAAGAGLLASALFKSKTRSRAHLADNVISAFGRHQPRFAPRRSFKAAVGSLALNYLSRRMRAKLRWR